ncbi:unnamed protein product [Effrenium voratum]|uniref:Methylthioribose-1-phosphate isomerase n=1 Tax=Effrenium voratum TaxID=2562239 RepID=A0AA36J184_9DINO|nr:unnamed protein product [Effrenium voratum]
MTTESFRKDVAKKLPWPEPIKAGRWQDAKIDFPNDLTSSDRKYIHKIAESFRLHTLSSGTGDARYISVYKNPPAGQEAKRPPRETGAGVLNLSPAAAQRLQHVASTVPNVPGRVLLAKARTIWLQDDETVQIIDQRHLPHEFVVEDIKSVQEMCVAIKDMHLRGAGLIGCAAAYGMYLSARAACAAGDAQLPGSDAARLRDTRPTAVNLRVGVERDAEFCQRIGEAGADILQEISVRKGGTVNVLTHCNAGWLAFADWGSALSPVYVAFNRGLALHVWVDETRPRNQGASLTAWELAKHGVPHTVIADNAGGHLMRTSQVDVVITGADRVTSTGDACNKIGTYLKALAARDNSLPFYVALPSSTIDWQLKDGADIPIEQRGDEEVKYAEGLCDDGKRRKVLLTPKESSAGNWAFDVTPARLVTGLLTERGLCDASEEGLKKLFA